LAETNLATSPPLDPVEDLVDAGPLGYPAQLAGEELLQRLSAALGTALEAGVDVLRNISD